MGKYVTISGEKMYKKVGSKVEGIDVGELVDALLTGQIPESLCKSCKKQCKKGNKNWVIVSCAEYEP